MKIELGKNNGGKSSIAFIVFFVCYAIISQSVIYAGGAHDDGKTVTNQEQRTLLRTDPAIRPKWIDAVPLSDTEFYFVGTSQIFNTPANARNDARENARIQVLEYYGQVIEKQAVSLSTVTGNARETLVPFVVNEEAIKTFAQNVVSEVATREYYTETYLNSSNKEEYVVYTLHQINRQKAESEIANFAKNISERYTAAFPQWKTLKSALEGYTLVAKSLEKNPLHRIMAYYETPTGKAGLYEYALVKISELASSISIEAIPTRTIQETETLTTPIKINSSIMPSTGLLDCKAILYSGNANANDVPYSFNCASDKPYNLQNRNLKSGAYNVTVEILLSDLTGGIAKNVTSNFSFTVTPLSVVLKSREEIEAGIKKAVDALAARLQTPTDTVIGTFLMTGTNAPSDLSLFLTEKVTHYATENQARKYKIYDEEGEGRAVLNGNFTKRNDRVDVTLKLTTPKKDADGSQIFSLSLALLEQIPIAVEPLNAKTMVVLDDIVPVPATETINIEARFNSASRTYKHADELELTVTADKDCYFKIIHIDAENNFNMIFPSKNDNNRLRAKENRAVFNTPTTRRVLCGPYGAETIVVVASAVQFPGIEKEYGQPWKAATEEALKKALAGSGEARYPITILKPHAEYEYTKPENMTATYQAISDDAKKQNGTFTGNAVSGYYVVDNVRGSYLVTSPNTIQFAYYSLDTYNGVTFNEKRTRGKPFDFSFTKPQNIKEAVQTVQTGITSKGGTFTGNEQQGNFKASGIAGQYKVTDIVNVTISEKPIVIPNSMIENEVKNFFGVK